MSAGRPRSNPPVDGDPLADPSLEKPLSALRALAGTGFDILGPLGRDADGEYAFLAREVSQDRLVVLKRRRSARLESADPGILQVITQLDSSVPPPAGSCPVCQAPFITWEPTCPECGSNVAGRPLTAPGTSLEKTLAAVRQAAQGYEVFGTMNRAVGGSPVFFARDLSGGHLVALRLEDGESGQPGYTITATRMMRPKLQYGAVGRETTREPGAPPDRGGVWTPIPSPSLPMPMPSHSEGSSPDPVLAARKICPQCNQTFASGLRLCPRDGTALRTLAVSDSLIGRILADRYHIVDRLGQGGMGTVYLAEHVRMGRRCAVKVMNPTLLNDPDSLDRFTREAKNASQLNHPHVAAIYDFGETSDGIVYLAMEFVEGESLAAVLDRVHGLPQQQALELASQVADGLSAAHEMGIVHRDLKPDNVMVCHSKSGRLRVKVVDFGIAKATQGDRQTVTRTGYVVGTPAYMSPEQILGDPLDGRSDLYSLGCILYEMLVGQRAFTSSSGEVSIRRRLTEPPPRPRSVKQTLSKSLDDVVTRAMARAPEQRFQSAAEMRDAMLAILQERPKKGRWHGLLHWSHSEESTPAPEPVIVPRTPQAGPPPSFLSPPPFVAAAPIDPSPAIPAPAEWVATATPRNRLRHRSARNEGSATGWLIGGTVAALLGIAGVFFVSGGDFMGYWSRVTALIPGDLSGSSKPVLQRMPDPIDLPNPAHSGPDTAAAITTVPGPAAGMNQAALPAAIRLVKPLPEGSRVTVDSVQVRPTEGGLIAVVPGSHVVRVRAPGYRSARRTLPAIAAGDTALLDLVLLPLPVSPADASQIDTAMGAIVVKGDLPPGAVIRIDGRVIAPGLRVLTVPAGSHSVSISVPGYATDSSIVLVEQGSWSDWSPPSLVAIESSDQEASAGSALPSAPENPNATSSTSGDSASASR